MMVEKFTVDKTRTTQLAEFLSSGNFHFVNYFAISGNLRYENGQLVGDYVTGDIMGENIGSCAFCGYAPLINHYTLEDKKTGRMLNVGEICIQTMQSVDKSQLILKGLKSLKDKINREYKKRVHANQLADYINDNLGTLNKIRNDRVDKFLKDNPEHYWLPETKTYTVDSKDEPVVVKRTLWERNHNAEKEEEKERNFWNYVVEKFRTLQWNARTMRDEVQKYLMNDGVDLKLPEFRKLLDNERNELNQMITKEVNDYIKKTGGKK